MLELATRMAQLDYLILGRLNYAFGKSSPAANVSCEIGFSYKVVSMAGYMVSSDRLGAAAPAASESAALERALEKLEPQFSKAILKIF
jgi:hypothetical protein